MTKAEFLKLLRKTPRRWAVDDSGAIRCAKGDCPITAVYRLRNKRHHLEPSEFEIAAKRLRVKFEASDVAYAADHPTFPTREYVDLRAELLRACGLSK